MEKMKTKDITLPRLNNLKPTLESTAFKLMEETGELAQAIGKFRGMSGERTNMTEQQVMDLILRAVRDGAQSEPFARPSRYCIFLLYTPLIWPLVWQSPGKSLSSF